MKQAKRRLTAVICADVAGYSRLMEVDEEGTLARLRTCRALMVELVASHDGRLVNSWGDALIFEVSSATEAVRCAVAIQDAMAAQNASRSDLETMAFRIGINIGDLMVEGDDIYGDGVNVAARLQELAPVGGILLSQVVYEQVHGHLALSVVPVGPLRLHNIAEPKTAYAIRPRGQNSDAVGTAASPPQQEAAGPLPEHRDDALPPHENGLDQARAWLMSQPRRVRASVAMIGAFFVLNLITSGLSNLWFYWPSLPFILFLGLHILLGDTRRDRRRSTG
ncbi:adenylate/guanylate cyclase domain-containing protein [Aurantimonas sp. VKM B-3413]|uniref:adenylate/guanylate cyclase domain-containing protein n=1 Tax=Aurantimonas sp. VKM B-3413 TaxID=2779401 RepID=UPI001E544100|nr:adenylate/guanylate cyclase domain-containing protein [Aurantimonas sp. VKM B-3413]MCB8836498.1 adenylate/guanylate cyclase domain-containing protein [Aurantimonas sp. VKM B-3413]